MPKVAIVMGSSSDSRIMEAAEKVLEQFNITFETFVISAHRTPEKARQFGLTAEKNGFEVIIAAAGYAAHLPGVLASWTVLPVIGVPLPSSTLEGIDSLYSINQMPAGVPVATVTVGEAGARNAALLAAEILSLKYPDISKAYHDYRARLNRA